MTDLIASLASRTLGSTPVLQPGATSIFAPRQHRVDHEPSNLITASDTVWNSDVEAWDTAEVDEKAIQAEELGVTVQTRPQPLVTPERSTLPLVRSPHAHFPKTQTVDVAELPVQSVEPTVLLDQPEEVIREDHRPKEPESMTVTRSHLIPQVSDAIVSEETASQPEPTTSHLMPQFPNSISARGNSEGTATPSAKAPRLDTPALLSNAAPVMPASPQASESLDPIHVLSQNQSDSIQSVVADSQSFAPILPLMNVEKTEMLSVQSEIQQNLESNPTRNHQLDTPLNSQVIQPELQRLSVSKADPMMSASENSVLPQSPSDLALRESSISPRPIEQITVNLPPPPTIQVTIERIDIRAATPPPPLPTRSRPTAPPKLSLDDYLKSRSRG